MIKFDNTLGTVSMTNEYFASLVSAAAKDCFGVAAMSSAGTADDIKKIIFGDGLHDSGVEVTEKDGGLIIELHIKVVYGLNIAAIVKSITHKVRYAVEEATNLHVIRIDVCVDDIVTNN